MKHRIFTRLERVDFSVDMGGKGEVEGEVVVGINTDVTLSKLSTAIVTNCDRERYDVRDLPPEIKDKLREVFHEIQKLVEYEHDEYRRG